MAYDLFLRRSSPRNFARDAETPTMQPYKEGLLGFATLAGIITLAAFQRHREIREARVQFVAPESEITTQLVVNPSMRELMYRRRST
jgi:hypothetical protein